MIKEVSRLNEILKLKEHFIEDSMKETNFLKNKLKQLVGQDEID